MGYDVHFFDRRTGERRVRGQDLEWNGPFWWSPETGNGGCDGNRSLFMYDYDPDQKLGGSGNWPNIIVVEKIICGNEIVYSDEVAHDGVYGGWNKADQLAAQLVAIQGFISDVVAAASGDTTIDLSRALARLAGQRGIMSGRDECAELLRQFDKVVGLATAIAGVMHADESYDVVADIDAIGEAQQGYWEALEVIVPPLF